MTDSIFEQGGKGYSLQEKLNHQLLIHDFVKEVLKHDTVNDILWTICNNVISKLGLEDCVIYLTDHKRQLLVQKAAFGPKSPQDQEIVDQIAIPLGEGVVGSVAMTGVAEIVKDTSIDPRYIVDDAFRLSEIAVPIINEGKVIGVIDSEHSSKNFYNDFHLQMLSTIASLCASRIAYAQIHEEVLLYKNKLEIIVEERTKKLKDSVEQLKISNDNLERYAYVVSHDLKSPLQTISAFSELIEMNEKELSDKGKQYLGIIKQTSGRMNTLLVELLNSFLSSDENKNDNLLDLNQVFAKVLENLKLEIDAKKAIVQLLNPLPEFKGLESHFIQLFQNIISNSIKYSSENEIPEIIVSVETITSGTQIRIRDNGIGIDKEFEKTIFNLGERSTDKYEGRGIGLDTCKHIIDHYKGDISAVSHGLGKGMTICIDLPNL